MFRLLKFWNGHSLKHIRITCLSDKAAQCVLAQHLRVRWVRNPVWNERTLSIRWLIKSFWVLGLLNLLTVYIFLEVSIIFSRLIFLSFGKEQNVLLSNFKIRTQFSLWIFSYHSFSNLIAACIGNFEGVSKTIYLNLEFSFDI